MFYRRKAEVVDAVVVDDVDAHQGQDAVAYREDRIILQNVGVRALAEAYREGRIILQEGARSRSWTWIGGYYGAVSAVRVMQMDVDGYKKLSCMGEIDFS